jgi:hypothetical protein
MPMLSVYVDDETLARLERASRQDGRSVGDLAESAVAEAALGWHRDNPERKEA